MDFAALQHSLFLHALGSAILNSLWQCFILWLVYETISVSYKSASARFKNNLSTLLLFLSFSWFLTSFIYKVLHQPEVTSVVALSKEYVINAQPGSHAISGFSTFLSYASASLPYLSVAYIFLLVLLISRLFAAYRYVYFISNKRLVHPTEELQFFARKVAAEIEIAKKISVWISHHIDVPATIGFIKPVILIPLASINNLSASQLEAIILHELAHIKRNDYITNLIISVIETILFFNPFVVLLSGIIKRERENCCDDFVLQYRYDPHSYASALLRLEQSRMSKLKLAIGAVSGKKQLLSRIKRITNSQVVSRQFNYGQKMIALLLVTAIICSVAWLTPEEKKPVQTKALTKEIKTALVSKNKLAGKVQQPVPVITADKAVGNVPLILLKHLSAKSEPTAIAEADIEKLPLTNSDAESDDMDENNADENKNTGDFFKVENHPEYSEALQNLHKLKQPRFSFDENGLKFPPFINVLNFPLQNMNFNIDLSKIDAGKLNENLKLAYKQINTLDWNKVQNEIQKSFSKIKLSNLSQREQDALFNRDKVKSLSKLNAAMHIQQQYNSKAVLEQLKKMLLMDSLQTTAQITLCDDENNTKMERTYKKVQMQYEKRAERDNYSRDNYSYNYSHSNVAPATPATDENEATVCSPKGNADAKSEKKTLRISIKRTSSHTGLLNEKIPFQFSVDNDDEKSSRDNIITVEITN